MTRGANNGLMQCSKTMLTRSPFDACNLRRWNGPSKRLGSLQIETSSNLVGCAERIRLSRISRTLPPRMLFLITQQFSLRVPDLQAMPIDYVVIWTQRFGGFERQFK